MTIILVAGVTSDDVLCDFAMLDVSRTEPYQRCKMRDNITKRTTLQQSIMAFETVDTSTRCSMQSDGISIRSGMRTESVNVDERMCRWDQWSCVWTHDLLEWVG